MKPPEYRVWEHFPTGVSVTSLYISKVNPLIFKKYDDLMLGNLNLHTNFDVQDT